MSMHNPEVVIQTKAGEDLYRAPMAEFWVTDAPHITFDYWNGSPVDGRVVFDPYYTDALAPQNGTGRWIAVAVADPNRTNASLLVAVSQTDDPTQGWHKYQIPGAGTRFITFPNVGFNQRWIAIHCVMTDFIDRVGRLYVLDKEDFYSGGDGWFEQIELTDGEVAVCPAITYDESETDLHLVQIRPFEIYPRIGRLTGDVHSPQLEFDLAHATVSETWAKTPADLKGFVPQRSTSASIATYHEQLWNVVYQNGSLWFSHCVYLPVLMYNRTVVQWWQIALDGTVMQFGRVDDPAAQYSYANPSLAVNEQDDVLLGFTRFSASTFPAAMYAYRSHLDPPGELRAPAIIKGGEAAYRHPNGGGVNAWGTTSASVMDPDGTNLWTLQEYAAGPKDRWGTWWAEVAPRAPVDLWATMDVSDGQVVQGEPIMYSILVSNPGPADATGTVVFDTLPPGVGFVSATSTVGACTFSNQTLTCTIGDLVAGAAVSLSIDVIAERPGVATNTVSAFSNEPDTNRADNFVLSATCIEYSTLPTVWINELHYDDTGLLELNDGVEIAGLAGTDLSGLELILYDGTTGEPYASLGLEGTIDAEANGYGAVWFPHNALQNGATPLLNPNGDGIVLATACGEILQFISYEGVIPASSGPAAGMISSDIGVAESNDTSPDRSLQLIGMGFGPEVFSWVADEPATPGELNDRQYFEAPAYADLGVSGSGVPPIVALEEVVVFSAVVTNAGPNDADAVVLKMAWPADMTFIGASTSQGTFQYASGELRCEFGSLPAAGGLAGLAATGLVTDVGTAIAAFTVYGRQNDTNTTNNADEVSVCEGYGANIPPVWINEFHYDDTNFVDVGEGVEIAGPAGTDLNSFSIVLYEGDNGDDYRVVPLSGVIDDEGEGYGAVWFPIIAIRNGQIFPPFDRGDGIALASPCTGIVEFISYETPVLADSGPAGGLVSADVGVYESSDATAVGESLQRVGVGTAADHFTWVGPAPGSPGQLNAGQIIPPANDPDLDGLPSDWETLHFGGPTNAVAGEDVDLDGFSNYAEFLADTIPTNAASYFHVEFVQSEPPGIGVQSSSNRLYSMESAADPAASNGWSDVLLDVPGTGGLLLMIDSNGVAATQLYRSRVRLP